MKCGAIPNTNPETKNYKKPCTQEDSSSDTPRRGIKRRRRDLVHTDQIIADNSACVGTRTEDPDEATSDNTANFIPETPRTQSYCTRDFGLQAATGESYFTKIRTDHSRPVEDTGHGEAGGRLKMLKMLMMQNQPNSNYRICYYINYGF